MSWMPNNTAAHTKRATAVAMAFISTNMGGIYSTWLFPNGQAPYYPIAAKVLLSLTAIEIALTCVSIYWYKRQDAKKDEPEYRRKVLGPVDGMNPREQAPHSWGFPPRLSLYLLSQRIVHL